MNTISEHVFSIPEINYQILRSNHPYYMKAICASNNTFLQHCDSNKYEILQVWIYPELSINDITFADVVDLSLVYNPIPESVNYYDCYTLFFHDCKRNQSPPEYYISKSGDFRDAKHHEANEALLWICYKFNRIDIIDRWLNLPNLGRGSVEMLDNMRNILSIKLGRNYFTVNGIVFLGFLHRLLDMRMMFTNNELFEILVIVSKLTIEIGKKPIDYILGTNIDLGANSVAEFTVTLAHYMNKQDMKEIISKYYPDVQTLPDISYKVADINRTSLSRYGNNPTLAKLYFNQKTWVPKYIPEAHRGIYYITSGLYVSYINWKQKCYTINNESKYDYFGAAPWGYFSLNINLCKAYSIPINYYNINTRTKDLPRLPGANIYKTFQPIRLR